MTGKFTRCLISAASVALFWGLLPVIHTVAGEVGSTLNLLSMSTVIAEQAPKKDAEPQSAEEKTPEKSADEAPEESADEGSGTDRTKSKSDQSKAGKSSASAEKKASADPEPPEDSKEKAADDETEAPDKEGPKPFVVKRKPLKIESTLDGVFVAAQMQEVAIRPESWSSFKVLEAVPHGTEVKQGDWLVRFDADDLEEKLAQEAIDQQLNELALMKLEEQSPRDLKLLELAYQESKERYDQLVEDHEHYLDTDRPHSVRVADYYYDSAKEDLASQEEELTQLKKMYEADELTEETEAIVLRRQEFSVDTAKLYLDLHAASRDYSLKYQLPRTDLTYENALKQAKLALEQAETAKKIATSQSTFELEKARTARARSVQNHAKLLGDRALMELRAPADGTVYYGRCINGQWAELSSLSTKLIPHGTITSNTVLMTIVKQRPLVVTCYLGEKGLPDYRKSQDVLVIPAVDDKAEVSGRIEKLATVPGSSRKFEVQIEITGRDLPDWLVAGMSCSVKVKTYNKPDALLVPKDLVQTDEENEKVKYVMLLERENEEPVRREVKLGRSKEKLVEVLSGLAEGDKIVKEEPKKEDKE